MKTKIKKNLIIVLATLFLFAFFVLSALPLTYANADGEIIYTNVMDDLKKDEKFNTDDYPAIKDDYSLKVIQIAESSAKELFVYTYQPAHDTRDLVATSINISTGTGDELSYWNYELRLLSTDGVFDKYLVKDFKVSTEEERTYDISNIYRAWNKDIDNATGNDNTISEVGYKVGKCFYSKTDENGNVLYGATETDVVTITDKYVDFVTYDDQEEHWDILGVTTTFTDFDCHYVAFSVDYEIDTLFSADIFFNTQSYTEIMGCYGHTSEKYGAVVPSRKTIYCDETVKIDNSTFWYESTRVWKRIQTASSFIIEEDAHGDTALNLSKKDWVLRFYETPRSVAYKYDRTEWSSTIVSDVSILRLSFLTDGIVYNLGVVDNKQSGDAFAGDFGHDCKIFELICIVVFVFFILWLVSMIAPWLYPFVGKLISLLFKAIWCIISFRWLRDIINNIKRHNQSHQAIVNTPNNDKRNRKSKKKPPTK